MITCKICEQQFKNIITWKHLKKHGMTTKEYKKLYGPVVSDEYRNLKSQQTSGKNNPQYGKNWSWTPDQRKNIKGRTPPNKGVPMSDEQKGVLSEKAIKRNIEWHNNNCHPHVGAKRSDETKKKISESRKNQIISPESIQKAIQTKKEKGYDLAFFRGKSHTDESKRKISKKSIENNKHRSEQSWQKTLKRIKEFGFDAERNENVANVCCPNGHEFNITVQYLTESKFDEKLCRICYPPVRGVSNAELEIGDFLENCGMDVLRSDRTLINPFELDIVVPEKNIAIEYCGLYWHSEKYTEKNKHLKKTEMCADKGYHLITVFEDEYINRRDVVQSRLKNLIGVSDNRIFARKCELKELDSAMANRFLENNHIQGRGRSNVRYGLYYNSELVAVMTFLKNDISKSLKGWELNRYCVLKNCSVVGGASKMFSAFVKNYDPEKVISYADRRWSSDGFYYKLGFEKLENTSINYWYTMPPEIKRYHRYSFRTTEHETEREKRERMNALRIWDCGHEKWEWTKL